MAKLSQFGMLLTAAIAFYGCGAMDAGQNGDGTGAPGSLSSIMTGSWSGNMVNKTVDAGSALHETVANASFAFTSDTEGSFSITLPKSEGAKAEGTFVDFAGKSLHLAVTNSNITAIGTTGNPTSINYNLVGNDLELYNDRVSFQLIKSNDQNSNQPTDSGNHDEQAETQLVGFWNCHDGSGYIWDFNVKSITSFSANITAHAGAAGLWIDGSLTTAVDSNKTVTGTGRVTSSNDNANVGMRLKMTLLDSTAIQVDRYKSKTEQDATVEDSFQCYKQG